MVNFEYVNADMEKFILFLKISCDKASLCG